MALWRWIWPLGKRPEDCPFCLLARGAPEGRTPAVLFQDEQVVAFKDRSPAAFRHYLVVPVDHIKNINSLRPSEANHALVLHMLKVGESLVHRDSPEAPSYRFGFHRPPFNSVHHLHLHCMALPYISWWRGMKYTSLGWWGAYVSAENVLHYLDPVKDSKSPSSKDGLPRMSA